MLQIEKENISTYQASVLYFSVIVEKKSKTQLFNKRDTSLFSIARTATFYSSIGSGILMFSRSNLGIISFVGVFNQRNKGVNIDL